MPAGNAGVIYRLTSGTNPGWSPGQAELIAAL